MDAVNRWLDQYGAGENVTSDFFINNCPTNVHSDGYCSKQLRVRLKMTRRLFLKYMYKTSKS